MNFGLASQRSIEFKFLDVLPRGPMDLKFWTCFPEVRWIGSLDVLPRGPMDWKFGRASKRSDGLNLDVLPRSLMDLWKVGELKLILWVSRELWSIP